MYISKLNLVNYRNFSNTKLLFKKGINTIIGENGSGKTNLFRAIRLLLDDRMYRSAFRMNEQDFCRNLSNWQGHWIIISLEFKDISQDEAIQSLFLHGTGEVNNDEPIGRATYTLIFRPNLIIRQELSQIDDGNHDQMNAILKQITIADYETVFTGRSTADFSDQEIYNEIAGDFNKAIFQEELEDPRIGARIPTMLSLSREISFTFIQALRDVMAEFHNSRTNPLLTLLKNKSGEIDAEIFEPIAKQVTDLNESIEELSDVKDVRNDISKTIKETAGDTYSPSSLSIKSDLSNEADKLFQSLKLFVGESNDGYEGGINELSLGGANLIYLTLKLLEFKYQKDSESFANFLLVEEPEAHIHTHIQKTLFDKVKFSDTQIIYSTHSPQISEVCNINQINILGINDSNCEAYQPAVGLSKKQADRVQRYLDAIRSNLLFAKSVILVEGDAEEILIPVLIKKVFGVSLDELGISLVNIRSTGFENVALLFHKKRIRKKCSIITDIDTSIIDTKIAADDSDADKKFKTKSKKSQELGEKRKIKLDNFTLNNDWIDVFYAENTFEVDFLGEGNEDEIIGTLEEIYTKKETIKKSEKEINSDHVSIYGRRVLKLANSLGKGWFAILLSKHITYTTKIPDYIIDALFFASNELSDAVWFDILKYRINCILKDIKDEAIDVDVDVKQIKIIIKDLKQFKKGEIDLNTLKQCYINNLPNDQISDILASII